MSPFRSSPVRARASHANSAIVILWPRRDAGQRFEHKSVQARATERQSPSGGRLKRIAACVVEKGISAAACGVAARTRDDAGGEPPAAGFAPIYSDLGYLLAGAALAKRLDLEDAGDAIAKLVLEPLGLAAEMGSARQLE